MFTINIAADRSKLNVRTSIFNYYIQMIVSAYSGYSKTYNK